MNCASVAYHWATPQFNQIEGHRGLARGAFARYLGQTIHDLWNGALLPYAAPPLRTDLQLLPLRHAEGGPDRHERATGVETAGRRPVAAWMGA
jgi:hypothetical protein